MNLRVFAAVAALSLLASCTGSRKSAVIPTYGLSADRSFIDVQPGWRLRVVTPLLRSGTYRISPQAESVQGREIELRTGSEFIGYELAYYEVRSGARIRLQSVEAAVDGRKELRATTAARLFDYPGDARFVRLVFFTRSSNADHDMAVLAARRFEDLDLWTSKLKLDPTHTCETTRYCSWIPSGIAVTAERRLDNGEWAPADSAGRPPRVTP